MLLIVLTLLTIVSMIQGRSGTAMQDIYGQVATFNRQLVRAKKRNASVWFDVFFDEEYVALEPIRLPEEVATPEH